MQSVRRSVGNRSALCENFPSDMPSPARKKIAGAIFVLLLLAAAGSALYAFFHPGPWIVPEEAKRMQNPLKPSQADLSGARKLYMDKCVECHGDSGKGDGSQARMYDPLPSNFTDAAHMNSISDGELFYKISEGHRPMPAFKKRFTEEQRWQLVLFLRRLAKSQKE
jgi:mono/diheme cytochrome c family protein